MNGDNQQQETKKESQLIHGNPVGDQGTDVPANKKTERNKSCCFDIYLSAFIIFNGGE